jgi:hypothetical protein
MRKRENRCLLWAVFVVLPTPLYGRRLRELVNRGMVLINLQNLPASPNLNTYGYPSEDAKGKNRVTKHQLVASSVAGIKHHGEIDTGEAFGDSTGLRRHGIRHVEQAHMSLEVETQAHHRIAGPRGPQPYHLLRSCNNR